MDYLKEQHNDAVNKVGGGQKLYDYTYTYNGFAAVITEDQAEEMKKVPGVLSVQIEEFFDMDTSSTPSFLGLTEAGGLWDQLGGIGKGGEDIIIGVIDSGIWPESLSFSDRTGTNGNNKKPVNWITSKSPAGTVNAYPVKNSMLPCATKN